MHALHVRCHVQAANRQLSGAAGASSLAAVRSAGKPRLAVALAALAAFALAACGKAATTGSTAAVGPLPRVAPAAAPGAVSVVTRNTTRLGGGEAVADAAAVARAVYPGLTPSSRPQAVVLADRRDWGASLAASVLAGAPLSAPLLFSEGSSLPTVSAQALEAMHPQGAPGLAGAQVIRMGTAATPPGGLLAHSVPTGEPAVSAAAIAQLLIALDGPKPPRAVIVLNSAAPRALQMPAAGLAAESGAPILFVTTARVPLATATVLTALHKPSIYVVNPSSVGARTLAALGRYGTVTQIPAPTSGPEAAATAAIELARFESGGFGWGVKEPGHGLVFANVARPLDAPAAALLSATGDYGPLMLFEVPGQIPAQLVSYLANIQPAYTSAPQFRPVRGVYNHGWLIGDESAISPAAQAELDSMLEITARKGSSEEPTVTPAE
jgi:hypothetical protein